MSEEQDETPKTQYLTTKQAAEYCRYKTVAGIYSAVRRGRLRVCRRGGGAGDYVFHVADLDAFLGRTAESIPNDTTDALPKRKPPRAPPRRKAGRTSWEAAMARLDVIMNREK